MEELLEKNPKAPLRVLVVWTPVLKTDLGPPTSAALALLKDARVRQFWDPEHVFSNDLVRTYHAEPRPIGYQPEQLKRPRFVVWDWAAVFDKRAHWGADLPAPAYAGGDVVSVIDDVRVEVANQLAR